MAPGNFSLLSVIYICAAMVSYYSVKAQVSNKGQGRIREPASVSSKTFSRETIDNCKLESRKATTLLATTQPNESQNMHRTLRRSTLQISRPVLSVPIPPASHTDATAETKLEVMSPLIENPSAERCPTPPNSPIRKKRVAHPHPLQSNPPSKVTLTISSTPKPEPTQTANQLSEETLAEAHTSKELVEHRKRLISKILTRAQKCVQKGELQKVPRLNDTRETLLRRTTEAGILLPNSSAIESRLYPRERNPSRHVGTSEVFRRRHAGVTGNPADRQLQRSLVRPTEKKHYSEGLRRVRCRMVENMYDLVDQLCVANGLPTVEERAQVIEREREQSTLGSEERAENGAKAALEAMAEMKVGSKVRPVSLAVSAANSAAESPKELTTQATPSPVVSPDSTLERPSTPSPESKRNNINIATPRRRTPTPPPTTASQPQPRPRPSPPAPPSPRPSSSSSPSSRISTISTRHQSVSSYWRSKALSIGVDAEQERLRSGVRVSRGPSARNYRWWNPDDLEKMKEVGETEYGGDGEDGEQGEEEGDADEEEFSYHRMVADLK